MLRTVSFTAPVTLKVDASLIFLLLDGTSGKRLNSDCTATHVLQGKKHAVNCGAMLLHMRYEWPVSAQIANEILAISKSLEA